MRILRFEDLASKGIPYSREHLRRLIKAGRFPKPVELSGKPGGYIGWTEAAIDQHMKNLSKAARQPKTVACTEGKPKDKGQGRDLPAPPDLGALKREWVRGWLLCLAW
jgi:predicted DNA-binding transcriptional regulator AlpA